MNRETTVEAPRPDLVRDATRALRAVTRAASRASGRHAEGYGLSAAKLHVLHVLSRCPGESSCLYSLGEELEVSRPNITKLVDGLEASGLVERRPHPGDRRMVEAHLTREGRRVAGEARSGRAEMLEHLWDALDDEELAHLVELLGRVAGRAAGEDARG